MPLPELAPITDADLPEFCTFLNRHLNPRITAAGFQKALGRSWAMDKPNHGFAIRDSGAIVGGIGAIYAARTLHGKVERFCNITSWCLLDQFRTQSMRLAMALLSQEGFHFTDFTPTELVAKSLQFLKFKPLEGSRTVIANLPLPSPGIRVVTEPEEMLAVLPSDVGRLCRDHVGFPWLLHAAVGKPEAFCYVAYKKKQLKGLPSAEIIGISDGELFVRYYRAFGNHALLRHGMATTRVESRLLPRKPAPAKQIEGFRPKMYLSHSLNETDIDNFYSELVTLDI